MQNDLEILDAIKDELRKVDHPPFDPVMIGFYDKLVDRVPEEGFYLLVADKDISEAEEQALRLLNRYEYVVANLEHHTRDGCFYHVDMRGRRFREIVDNQTAIVGMHDSGKRETFATGAVRDTAAGKPRPDLFSPFAMERIGLWLMRGAEKYSEHNWSKGIPASRCMASLHRHLMRYMQGATDEDHLSAVATNCMMLLHFEEVVKRGFLPESLLDLPKYNTIPSVHKNNDEMLDFA